MKKLLRFLFRRPVRWLASRFSSAPKQDAVNSSLSRLLENITTGKKRKGLVMEASLQTLKLVVMSDHHKGAGNKADDFVTAEKNYTAALEYYNQQQFLYVALGDVEELWENDMEAVYNRYKHHLPLEEAFVANSRFYKVYGNHDLLWQNRSHTNKNWLTKMYRRPVPVYEGLVVNVTGAPQPLRILLTHGHQGDSQSDGNRFSKWFVSVVWSRVQAFLDVNVNTPAKDFLLRDKHNIMMYEWSATQPHTILITGHTHKPVFASLSHLEKLRHQLKEAQALGNMNAAEELQQEINRRAMEDGGSGNNDMKKPSYFNTGCCCYSDGDITAIEIENGRIRLVKWHEEKLLSSRTILEEAPLEWIASKL
jgi:predicted phosphodiesterase